MCGFCGVVGPSSRARGDAIDAMSRAIAHRGPDDHGTWSTRLRDRRRDEVVALGHQRLSIIDLSPLGHQPMTTVDGALTVAYNGEIYNFEALRRELEEKGTHFRSRCDTEVILGAFAAWGVDSFERLNGMFAFALWDDAGQRLYLVRDRVGIKPLYYRFEDGLLLFGSELKALRAHPSFSPVIDRGALGRYLRHGYVCGPETIYAGTHRLMPGDFLVWERGHIEVKPYVRWDAAPAQPPPAHFDEVVNALDGLLGDAVQSQMVSDVPLGAFLSGGVDSSAVVALMQERSTRRVQTFSIGFREDGWDEAPFARAVAAHLKTEHHELYVGRDDAVQVAEELPRLYDEPFADASAIPTVLLSRLTRQHVTVALSGDGGDELFGGYGHHLRFHQLRWMLRLPMGLRRVFSALAPLAPLGPLRNFLSHMHAPDGAHAALRLESSFEGAALANACGEDGGRPTRTFLDAYRDAPTQESARRLMYADARLYLPDDILVKVDRASMSVGLEARVPILDHRIVQFGLALPLHMIWRNGQTKSPLREVLYRRVPRALIDRPKKGFGIPIHTLLQKQLAHWSSRHLSPERLREQGILDPDGVESLLADTRQRFDEVNGVAVRWRLICFQRWYAATHLGDASA